MDLDLRTARSQLAVAPGASSIEIRRAHFRRLRDFRPDQDSAGFMRLRAAYELLVEHGFEDEEPDEVPLDRRFMEELIGTERTPAHGSGAAPTRDPGPRCLIRRSGFQARTASARPWCSLVKKPAPGARVFEYAASVRSTKPTMASMSSLSRWIQLLQCRDRYTFTCSQLEADTGRSTWATQAAIHRLKKQGRVVSPRRGFYVLVPPGFQAAGAPPATWFIDDLMRHLGQPYHVGLLSAAVLHGAAHQQPRVFQVVTSQPTRELKAGKVAIRFWASGRVEELPVVAHQTEIGTLRVATPETTAFDLVRYPAGAGHLSNTAMVLAELAERLDARVLVEIAPLVRLVDVQRLGHLLDAVGRGEVASPLAEWLSGQRPRTVPLHPGAAAAGALDRRWHVLPNVELELDR